MNGVLLVQGVPLEIFPLWKKIPASIPLEVVFAVSLMYLPHCDILNCFFFFLTSVVSLTRISHNISTDIFNLTDVWTTRIGVIQEQLDVTICPPPLQERSAMLYQTDWLCPSHSKVWDSFHVSVYSSFFNQFHSWCVQLTKFSLGAIMRSACLWCPSLGLFQTVSVTFVTHTVLS